MSMPLIFLVLLVLATLGVFAYRKFVSRDSDELVHLGEGSVQAAAKQVAYDKTVTQVDKVVKILMIVTVVYGVALGAFMIYQQLNGASPS
jgi:uncharacterized membrane protein